MADLERKLPGHRCSYATGFKVILCCMLPVSLRIIVQPLSHVSHKFNSGTVIWSEENVPKYTMYIELKLAHYINQYIMSNRVKNL